MHLSWRRASVVATVAALLAGCSAPLPPAPPPAPPIPPPPAVTTMRCPVRYVSAIKPVRWLRSVIVPCGQVIQIGVEIGTAALLASFDQHHDATVRDAALH